MLHVPNFIIVIMGILVSITCLEINNICNNINTK